VLVSLFCFSFYFLLAFFALSIFFSGERGLPPRDQDGGGEQQRDRNDPEG